MRIRIKVQFFLLLAMTALSTARSMANAQSPVAANPQTRAELALNYNYLRSNAPPDSCTCFSLNGGSASFAWKFRPASFALVGDLGVVHSGNISSNSYSLTLSSYTAGIRYSPRFSHSPLQPYGQVLAGVAHSSGSLVESQNTVVSNAGASFAANVGGGVDLRTGRHFSIRLFEVDYLLTKFNNGTNNRQNNLRIGTGIILRF